MIYFQMVEFNRFGMLWSHKYHFFTTRKHYLWGDSTDTSAKTNPLVLTVWNPITSSLSGAWWNRPWRTRTPRMVLITMAMVCLIYAGVVHRSRISTGTLWWQKQVLMYAYDDVSFYNSTASTWTLATPRTTWESIYLDNLWQIAEVVTRPQQCFCSSQYVG